MARILVTGFCAVPGPRRSSVQLRHVIRALAATHEVDVLVVREQEQSYVERQGAVRVLRVPRQEGEGATLLTTIAAFQRALKRQLEGDEYDVVHCVDPWAAQIALETRRLGTRVVVYDHARAGSPETWPHRELGCTSHELGVRAEALAFAAMAEADLVVVGQAADFDSLPRVPREKLKVIPVGVDVDRFDWDSPSGNATPSILFLGTLGMRPELVSLLEAFTRVLPVREAQLRLVGPWAHDIQDLVHLIDRYGLTPHVELAPAIEHDQAPLAIAASTLCVCPSTRVSARVSTKLLEYLACQRPVVAAASAVHAIGATHGVELWQYGDDNIGELAQGFLHLLAHPDLANQLAAAGYGFVRSRFTASSVRRAVRVTYDWVSSTFALRLGGRGEARDEAVVGHGLEDDFDVTSFDHHTNVDATTSPQDPPSVRGSNVGLGDHRVTLVAPAVPGDDSSSEVLLVPLRPGDDTGSVRLEDADLVEAHDDELYGGASDALAAQQYGGMVSGEIDANSTRRVVASLRPPRTQKMGGVVVDSDTEDI